MVTVMFVGHGRSGKDTASELWAKITGGTFAGSTSRQLAYPVAAKLGISPDEAYARRHKDRDLWYKIGVELRECDPAILIRQALTRGNITNGARDAVEVRAARDEGLIDLIVWIDRDVPSDPTMRFGPEEADVIVQNGGTLEDLEAKLFRLARALGEVSWS